jgi:small subunit ribosomal protein S6
LATTVTREYELVLMLDPETPDERREQITAETRARIESGGTLKQDTSWGVRNLAYEIEKRMEADYRLFRFEGQGSVLDELSHNLRIADGVLRFRIFKVDPRSPSIVPPAAMAPSSAAPQRGPRRPEAAPAAAEPQPESAEAATAEPAAPAADQASEAPEASEAPAAAEPPPEDAAPAETPPAETAPDAATEAAPEEPAPESEDAEPTK